MSLEKKYSKEVKQILAKYPPEHKRSAVMPLLYLAQREEGYVNKESMKDIASILDITETEVASIIGFYSLYHDKKAGKYRMQVCNDLPCALRGSDEFLNKLCENLGVKVGETTEDGLITIEAVTCLASCDRAPMFQTQGPDGIKYHDYMTIDRTMELIEALKGGK
ncbi:MAG TPA: NAD(P)H-dependent oxidoreductase subunit E [Anaerolineales bacterium]|nr:NAD(P)H-dependent oxidoreductase subunit E [Anaerolineales bacterium]HNB40230.1 NAD(P)H-dependent oxidoreductase subunit E [Anaerolineales bacterium]HNE05875.1 NAD(P)H-dependent oxidoreductase subunit E [Anaerolineales bacterium]HNF95064.1 NAD(P)H-dependent oxidoreductase subunit E [Anaerolineales bacterium]HNH26113.1 NAD(P)H-dependent oxidoreductase subunit E [Anaerolineales bacterium]